MASGSAAGRLGAVDRQSTEQVASGDAPLEELTVEYEGQPGSIRDLRRVPRWGRVNPFGRGGEDRRAIAPPTQGLGRAVAAPAVRPSWM
jgi:hypothetical protein